MKNRDIYQKDPTLQKLVNEGVANVNDDSTVEALAVLRYEVETFVCDGQYEKGLSHILDTYLKNIDKAQQPAVWVSGFYGSGKSHFVKILRALWVDQTFPDGATARGVANLPTTICDNLKELTIQAKRHGGVHAASGTLGSSASGSVRLALLRIVFKSAGLPEQYPVARFVMWLKSEGVYDTVKAHVESNGHHWEEELENFYVAEGLYEALCAVKPKVFVNTMSPIEIMPQLYPNVSDVSSDDMVKAIEQALTRDGKFPLTVIALDEVQQFIGEDSLRSMDVQEAVEACCKKIGGKLLFIGTGQTAVTGTANLKRLEGRFTMRIELSDTDVDAVIRQVILAKKPETTHTISSVMTTNIGEISKHLASTSIGHRKDDEDLFVKDYPILPVRRRFWENTLRVMDLTGTESQLRNQLSMVHKVIQTNLEDSVGYVVPADYLYFDSADKLLQSRALPRLVHEKTMSWINGNDDQKLLARACGLVYLINCLAAKNTEIGIKATVDTLADLMVENINEGSSGLRSKLPGLMEKCDLLMKVGEEFRIQTEESAAWNDEFQNKRSQLLSEAYRIEAERDDRIKRKFSERMKSISIIQGASKQQRQVQLLFDAALPADKNEKIYIWVRDGWSVDENSVIVDARQAGNQSPTILVHIPKRSGDELRHSLIEYKAAFATLDAKGLPNSPEGIEARAAMETTRQTAENKINELLDESLSGAKVFQGGGNELSGSLQEMLREGAENALVRLYPNFTVADHIGWPKVYEKAKEGAPDALKSVGDDGEPARNPVCKAILNYIGGGKKGSDLRDHFEASPYGWSRDAVDGGIQVLLIAGLARCLDERGQAIDPRELERRNIGKTMFKVESTNISAVQRIQIRKVMQKAGVNVKQNEEAFGVADFLKTLYALADASGGDAPKPEAPDLNMLEGIRLSTGNEQLMAIFNESENLINAIEKWTTLGAKIVSRWPGWQSLERLMSHATDMSDAMAIQVQINAIKGHRQLLNEPDPVKPLIANLSQLLREVLNHLDEEYQQLHDKGMLRLESDETWMKLEPEQKNQLLSANNLNEKSKPAVKVTTTEEILSSLDTLPLSMFKDRVSALSSRFEKALGEAAKLLEPKIQFASVAKRMLKSEDDIDAWIEESRTLLLDALKIGPVMIK